MSLFRRWIRVFEDVLSCVEELVTLWNRDRSIRKILRTAGCPTRWTPFAKTKRGSCAHAEGNIKGSTCREAAHRSDANVWT